MCLNCWYSRCAAASPSVVHLNGSPSPFVTTGSAAESADPGDVKLLTRSDAFFHGPFELLYSVFLSHGNKCNQNLRSPGVGLHVDTTAHFSGLLLCFL